MMKTRLLNFSAIQRYVFGVGLIFPDTRDELAFLHFVGKRNLSKSCALHIIVCAAWLSVFMRTQAMSRTDLKDRWTYTVAGAFMAFMALSYFSAVIVASLLSEWYYWWHEHVKAALAFGSIYTFMEVGILLQSKEPYLFNGLLILLLLAIELAVDQVRFSTAVWLWALQLGALVLMSVGQQLEGAGRSQIPVLLDTLLLCSIFGIVSFSIAQEARARLEFCRIHDRQRGALGKFWESANVFLLQCKAVMRDGIFKMGRVLRCPFR